MGQQQTQPHLNPLHRNPRLKLHRGNLWEQHSSADRAKDRRLQDPLQRRRSSEGLHEEDLRGRWSGGREEESDLGAKESRGGCFEDLLPLRGGGRCKHTKLGSGILFSSLILIT